MKRLILILSMLIVLAGFPTISKASTNVPEIPINAIIYPIYKPDFDSPNSCSQTSVVVARNDQKDFTEGDIIEVGFYAKEYTLGAPVTSSRYSVLRDIYTNLSVNKVSVPIQLCVRNITGQYISGEIKQFDVKISFKKSYTILVSQFMTQVPLLVKTPEAIAIEKLLSNCEFESKKDWNAVITQAKPNVAKGKEITLTGTFFRSGIPSPNDTLRIYQDFNTDPKRGNVKLLATSVTDKNGVFKFTFVPKSKSGIYSVTFQPRTTPIGPIHGPFESGGFNIDIDCGSTCNYEYKTSIVDWIPKHSASCLSAYEEYQGLLLASDDSTLMYKRDGDLIPFLFKKVFAGSKNKKAYFTDSAARAGGYSRGSSQSGGGLKKCWVNGYTTRTGKSVSGYWRSC